MSLAPIVLFVYNRPDHTKQTLEAFQKNELASDSELFIYSDAAKNETVQEKVNEVRDYVKTINQMIFRFSKLQDTIGNKVIPSILELNGEKVKKMTFIDRLNRLEELELL